MMSRLSNCMLMRCWLCGAIAIVIASCHGARITEAQRTDRVRQQWATGINLRNRLNSPIDVTWVDTPLRPALSRVEASFQTAFFLDRRVDPSLKINFSSKAQRFSEFIEEFTHQNRLRSLWVGPVVYVGPDANAECGSVRLDVLADFIAERLPRQVARKWQTTRRLQWPHLTEPRKLVMELAKKAKVKVINIERIPHDLWFGEDLPALSLVNRFGIILLGFDLSFDIDQDGNITIVPIDPTETITLDYPLSAGLAQPLEQFQLKLSGASLRTNRAICTLTGTLQQHVQLRHWFKSNQKSKPRNNTSTPSSDRSVIVYSLRIQQQPFQPVIESLARKLQLTTEWDPAISDAERSQRISFQVQNATMLQLLESATSAAGVQFRIEADRLRILPSNN